jgi:hypothetical protein
MKKFLMSKKGLVLLATMVVAVATAVGAYAYWTQGGSGSGSATAGTTTDVTVNQTSVTASTLYPGGPSEALSGTFTNPNASPVNIGSVTAVVSSITGAGTPDIDHPACTTGQFSIGGSSGPYTGVTTGSAWSGLTISLSNNGLNQDTCKSAVAHITYTANAGV